MAVDDIRGRVSELEKEVALEFVEVKNLAETHKIKVIVYFSKADPDGIFDVKRQLNIQFESGKKQVATFRSLFLIRISKWEDLTDDQELIDTLREVYDDDVEQLDLLVGMAAEEKIKGFAISKTDFVIFIIMASRRLEADRFFTSDVNEEVYTKKGLELYL
ncbi:heme peroxidase [Artemisia annua]|uniref:Heme peroxidase n=1 Tax=Artemisia annua TaxID=35608 RepID=A0A2U1MGR8_ARTAN|nr:heme peroxidase [Artemisia annua]